ncbi:MAG: hypothetical protein HUU02_14025 [Bacteroidetes bacterium]|nr:hypothetical protein [Bacteroidota bacterium]
MAHLNKSCFYRSKVCVLFLSMFCTGLYAQNKYDSLNDTTGYYLITLSRYFESPGVVFTDRNKETFIDNDLIKYTPTESDVDLAEKLLVESIKKYMGTIEAEKSFVLKKLRSFSRQYYGAIDSNQNKYVFINIIFNEKAPRKIMEEYYTKTLIRSFTFYYNMFLGFDLTNQDILENNSSLFTFCLVILDEYPGED